MSAKTLLMVLPDVLLLVGLVWLRLANAHEAKRAAGQLGRAMDEWRSHRRDIDLWVRENRQQQLGAADLIALREAAIALARGAAQMNKQMRGAEDA